MFLEKENLRLLNGSFFRVNLREIPPDDLRSILRACGLKSAVGSSSNQQISLLEGVREYLLTGELSELNDLSNLEFNRTGSKRSELNYNNIISEDFVTVELIIRALRKSPLILEKIMLSGSISTSEVVECCSTYLDAPRRLFTSKSVLEKVRGILASLGVRVVVG